MPRTSKRIAEYTSKGRGACTNTSNTFDTIQEVLNTLFDIRCSQKKKWGYEWYDNARYGYYDKAREELVTKPACMAKSVALQCISDLEYLRTELARLEAEKPCIIGSPDSDDLICFTFCGPIFLKKDDAE